MTALMTLVQVVFRGDILEAIKLATGEILVNPIAICNALGIDWEPQRKKLAKCEWARTSIMEVRHPQDGRPRPVTMIPLKIVPMWLSQIHVNKVNKGSKSKLLAYQLEVVEVLSAWFLGFSDVVGLADEMQRLKRRLAAMESQIESTNKQLESTSKQLGRVNGKFLSLVGKGECDEYLTLRDFVDRYDVRGILGDKIPMPKLRGISIQVSKLSQAMRVEVRRATHARYGFVNTYRLDILQGWFAVTRVANVIEDKQLFSLSRGRAFVGSQHVD